MITKTIPVSERNESEVSTLVHAAKISHMVNETTIGAFSRPHSKVSVEPKAKMNNVQRQQSSDPWKRDVWRTVDLETEKSHSNRSSINLMDCRAIQLKMALKSAERMRQKQVRLEMEQRQHKLNELDEMMQNLKIDLTEKSATKLQKNLLLKEEQIIKVVQQIETNSKLAEEQAEREIEESRKKMAEKVNRLKRVEEVRGYFQSIKSMKDLFIMLFEKYVKTCVMHQQHLKNFDQYTQAREAYLTRYESIITLVNAGQLTSTEVETLETICDDIKEMQRSVDEEIKASEELDRLQSIADREEKLRLEEKEKLQQEEQHRQLELQKQQQLNQQHQQRTKPIDAPDANLIAATDSNAYVSRERLSHYQNIMQFFEEYEESVKPLHNDEGMKKFRFDCKKCVNILSNSISSASPKHLQDKYDRFVLILSGNSVEIGGTRVTPSQHPLGIRYVNLLVAKMFVQQADTSIDVNPISAFPIASLIVALWQKFPDFGNLFLANLYRLCPFMVPYHLQQIRGQSEQGYLKMIGFAFMDNVCEEKAKFLKRLTGLVRLYASVFIAKTRRTVQMPHPQGIEFAWIWLTNLINLHPIADVSATMLHEFILIVGADMWATFNHQFVKVLNVIKDQYILELNRIDSGGPTTRLQGLIAKILSERKIDPPKELLPANFW